MAVCCSFDRWRCAVGVAGRAALLAGWLTLAGCAGEPLYWEPRVHVVQSGETLYSIAWRHGLNPQDLARWNGLANADLIFAGQRLRLTSSGSTSRARAASAGKAASRPPSKPLPAVAQAPAPAWVWPTSGPVVRRFGDASGLAEGVGIGGRSGQNVRAAAAGQVVYTGSGLMGYGQLIIIKHNETYLSAYGHNKGLLVKESDAVKSGQTIARMGIGPGGTPLLHFEIRRDGDPLDPLRFLPVR